VDAAVALHAAAPVKVVRGPAQFAAVSRRQAAPKQHAPSGGWHEAATHAAPADQVPEQADCTTNVQVVPLQHTPGWGHGFGLHVPPMVNVPAHALCSASEQAPLLQQEPPGTLTEPDWLLKFLGLLTIAAPEALMDCDPLVGNWPKLTVLPPENWRVPPLMSRKFAGIVKSGVTPPGRLPKFDVAMRMLRLAESDGMFDGKVNVCTVEPLLKVMVWPPTNCWLLKVVLSSMN
jgi:hypothetical protein